MVEPLDSLLPPELSILQGSSTHSYPKTGTASRLPFIFPPPVSDDGVSYLKLPISSTIEDQILGNGEPEKYQEPLNIGLSVYCDDTRMVVSVDKESLQVGLFFQMSLPGVSIKTLHYTFLFFWKNYLSFAVLRPQRKTIAFFHKLLWVISCTSQKNI